MRYDAHQEICVNCLAPIEDEGLYAGNKVYCCSGCTEGGPCICTYGRSPALEVTGGVPGEASHGEVLSQRVDELQGEFEGSAEGITSHSQPEATLPNLIGLLKEVATLLKVIADELGGGQLVEGVSRKAVPKELRARVSIRLVVHNISDPLMADEYAAALEDLSSVSEIMLIEADGSTASFRVLTSSKARFMREVLTIKECRPMRIKAEANRLTVTLEPDKRTPMDLPDTEPAETVSPLGIEPGRRPSGLTEPASVEQLKTVEVGTHAFFNSRHFLNVGEEPGPVEKRSWRMEVSLEGHKFDRSGTVRGFEEARSAIEQLAGEYNNKLLNNLEPYNRIQPSPENVAATLYDQIQSRVADLPLRVKLLKLWSSPTHFVLHSEPVGHAV